MDKEIKSLVVSNSLMASKCCIPNKKVGCLIVCWLASLALMGYFIGDFLSFFIAFV